MAERPNPQTGMTESVRAFPAEGSRRGALRGLTILLLSLLVGVPLVLIACAVFGRVEGVEFCPQDFSRRQFSYYEIPLVGIQVTAVYRTVQVRPVEKALLAERWISIQPPQRWDLIRGIRARRVVDPGDASILTRYLDALDPRGSHQWLGWSQDHPPLAQQLWPRVAEVARAGFYELVPDLMRAASRVSPETDHEQFAAALDQVLARSCQELADRYAAAGHPAAAGELYGLARARQPPDDAAKTRRKMDALRESSSAP
jgi:hypothetical protein